MELTSEQINRYKRHISLMGFGEEGQKKLLESKVLVVGAGGLGSPVLMYLAAAGVGTIGIVDGDNVDIANLQRQIIHGINDVGTSKAVSAEETINNLNTDVNVILYKEFLNSDNILEIIKEYDFIVECTDNFETKFLINDACVKAMKPFSHGGVLGFNGQLMTYVPGKGPCYRCIFGDVPAENTVPTCKEEGVMGCLPGVIGSLQAMEAIKYLTGTGKLLTGYLLTYDSLNMNFRKVKLPKKVSECIACGNIKKH